MKATIETINGAKYTVVHHVDKPDMIDDFRGEVIERNAVFDKGIVICFPDGKAAYTFLPALPRYPSASDARLMMRYYIEGINILLSRDCDNQGSFFGMMPTSHEFLVAQWWNDEIDTTSRCKNDGQTEITRAFNHKGDFIEIAITDERGEEI